MAKRIGINPRPAPPAPPAGTTSSILGTSSGIHPHHAKRYFRRAQANGRRAARRFLPCAEPQGCRKVGLNPNGTDVVLTFCIQASPNALTKRDVDAAELLRKVKLTKENWIDAGKRPELCAQPWLSHNVSNTISAGDSEWASVEDFIFENRHAFAGVSLLPEGGDLDYLQALFCEVLSDDEIVATTAGALASPDVMVGKLRRQPLGCLRLRARSRREP